MHKELSPKKTAHISHTMRQHLRDKMELHINHNMQQPARNHTAAACQQDTGKKAEKAQEGGYRGSCRSRGWLCGGFLRGLCLRSLLGGCIPACLVSLEHVGPRDQVAPERLNGSSGDGQMPKGPMQHHNASEAHWSTMQIASSILASLKKTDSRFFFMHKNNDEYKLLVVLDIEPGTVQLTPSTRGGPRMRTCEFWSLLGQLDLADHLFELRGVGEGEEPAVHVRELVPQLWAE